MQYDGYAGGEVESAIRSTISDRISRFLRSVRESKLQPCGLLCYQFYVEFMQNGLSQSSSKNTEHRIAG
jgi:hypothetical protein